MNADGSADLAFFGEREPGALGRAPSSLEETEKRMARAEFSLVVTANELNAISYGLHGVNGRGIAPQFASTATDLQERIHNLLLEAIRG